MRHFLRYAVAIGLAVTACRPGGRDHDQRNGCRLYGLPVAIAMEKGYFKQVASTSPAC